MTQLRRHGLGLLDRKLLKAGQVGFLARHWDMMVRTSKLL